MKNKFALLIIAVLTLLLPLTLSVVSQQQVFKQYAATNHQVTIQNYTMNPTNLTVKVGDTVTWTNQDEDLHDAHSNQEVFRSPMLSKGQSWSFTFNQPGTFEYYCTPHKGSMKGYTITVVPAEAAAPPPQAQNPPPQQAKTVQLPLSAPTTAPLPTQAPPQQQPPQPVQQQEPQNNQPGTTQSVSLSVILLLDGIGSAGDHKNPQNSSLSNKNPKSTQLPLAFILFDSSGKPAGQATGMVTYTPASGDYRGSITLGPEIKAGTYTIKVKMLKYLMKNAATNFNVSGSGTKELPPIRLTAGDIDNNNILDVKDYNSLLSCIDKETQPSTCDQTQKQITDLNDDGSINVSDINLFLREFAVGKGE